MSVCAKFQLSSWSRSGLKVPGGGVGWGGVCQSVKFGFLAAPGVSVPSRSVTNSTFSSCFLLFLFDYPKVID